MLDARQAGMINRLFVPKFLATADESGRPNLVIVTSMEFYQGQLIMGNLLFWKTARNLELNRQVAVLVIDTGLNYFTVEGNFAGFEETGELLCHLNRGEMVRYNAYSGFRNAGIIDITAVSSVKKLSPVRLLGAYLRCRMARRNGPTDFPPVVAEKFSMLKSIKVAAYKENGKLNLRILPAVGARGSHLLTATGLPEGVDYAANVITADVVSFQVKGTVEARGLKVEQVYATAPPVPGKLIYNYKA